MYLRYLVKVKQSHFTLIMHLLLRVCVRAVLDACRFNGSESRPYPAGTSVCLHNARCEPSLTVAGLYTCICQDGFTGARCEIGPFIELFIFTTRPCPHSAVLSRKPPAYVQKLPRCWIIYRTRWTIRLRLNSGFSASDL